MAMLNNLPYIKPLYPMFALGVGWLLAPALRAPGAAHHRPMLLAMVVMAAMLAEGN